VRDVLSHRSGSFLFPSDATVATMCDWEWVANRIARMHPVHEPGRQNAYHAYTFGYILGELVRRTDPSGRTLHAFLRQELFERLEVTDGLWLGNLPSDAGPRVAIIPDAADQLPNSANAGDDVIKPYPSNIWPLQQTFGQPEVLQFGMPSAGAIGNARSVARFFAMLANRGEMQGIRYLSENLVPTFCVSRPPGWDLDHGDLLRMSIGGFWLPCAHAHCAPMGVGSWVLGHPGSGGNFAWADLEHKVGVAIAANQSPTGRGTTLETNQIGPLGAAIREELGITT